MRIRVSQRTSGSTQFIESNGEHSILDACLRAGLNVAYRCASGNCGLCVAWLARGEIHYRHGTPLGLPQSAADAGSILMCQAHALTDLEIEITLPALSHEARIKQLPCRVASLESFAHDVLRVELELPRAESFDYKPGQYVDVLLSAGRRRSFSIASWPNANHRLELHVRRVPGGAFTDPLFDPAFRAGGLLTIEGPLGVFTYRDCSAPMLMIAGGTGLAPLLCMIRYVLRARITRRLRLFWGCRTGRDLYFDAQLLALTQAALALEYTPVLSQAGDEWRGERGFVHDVALRLVQQPEQHDVYLSGPPEMIDAALAALRARGVPDQQISTDVFDYASDSVARHSAIARTKS